MIALAFLEGGIQLVPDGTIFIHIALILLMIWILNRTFFRPINKVLEARSKSRGGHSSEAETLNKQAEEKSAAYEKQMLDARSKGYEAIEKERTKAVTAKQQQVNAVKEEVSQLIETEKAAITQQAEEARNAISSDAETLAAKIASNILKN